MPPSGLLAQTASLLRWKSFCPGIEQNSRKWHALCALRDTLVIDANKIPSYWEPRPPKSSQFPGMCFRSSGLFHLRHLLRTCDVGKLHSKIAYHSCSSLTKSFFSGCRFRIRIAKADSVSKKKSAPYKSTCWHLFTSFANCFWHSRRTLRFLTIPLNFSRSLIIESGKLTWSLVVVTSVSYVASTTELVKQNTTRCCNILGHNIFLISLWQSGHCNREWNKFWCRVWIVMWCTWWLDKCATNLVSKWSFYLMAMLMLFACLLAIYNDLQKYNTPTQVK